jgi:predicted Zn-dependent peptidase
MADLDAASLDDVKSWFKAHYGPNNAVLVLAGDIDAKTARPLVQHWFGAIDQTKLDNQRSVVQNEKRQGDNQPYGLVEYAQLHALFPEGHPYHHSTIGSMADLDAASLDDVKSWFKAHYGPNNAVLVLAGDIDAKTARPMVEHWFGAIPRGPETVRPVVTIPTLAAPVDQVMHDHVAMTRLYRNWAGPGVNDADAVPLDIALNIIGGLASSRFDTVLVRQDKVAVSASASLQMFENVSLIELLANVKPGIDPATVATKLDAIVADFLKTGPTADEVKRAATREIAAQIAGLESVGGFGGKAVTLAEGAVYANDPAKYKKDLAAYAAATPAEVLAAARKWLGRPAFRLTVAPGERSAADLAAAGDAARPRYYRDPAQGGAAAPAISLAANAVAAAAAKAPAAPDRSHFPPVQPISDIEFPQVERTTLSNGITVVLARRTTIPAVRLSIAFDAGNAADRKDKLGTQSLTHSLLDEGTTTRTALQIAEEQERLGASIGVSASMDRSSVSLFALKANLAPSLELLSDIVRNPAFRPDDVERLRSQRLAGIAAEKTEPRAIARRILPVLLYGADHPYGIPMSGSGTEEGVKAITRADLTAFHDTWFRPDNARIFVVGDVTLAEIVPLLEARFGTWAKPAIAKGTKVFPTPPANKAARIILVDRPQSPQSYIMAGELLPFSGTSDPLAFATANEVIGGSFLSRLNTDLRETKGWSYGVSSTGLLVRETMPFYVVAPVQTARTGDSIVAALGDINAFLTTKGITPEERERTIANNIRSLPGSFETSTALLGALVTIDTLHRPDDYYAALPARYRAFTAADLDKAARAAIDPARLTWVIVGDAAQVRPQLEQTGLPIEVMKPGA